MSHTHLEESEVPQSPTQAGEGRFLRLLHAIRQSGDHHPLFWITLGVAVFVVWKVPQVSRVAFQFPTHSGMLVSLGYALFLLLLIGFYGASLFVVHRPYPLKIVRSWFDSWPAGLRRVLCQPPEVCCSLLDRLLVRLHGQRTREDGARRAARWGLRVAFLGFLITIALVALGERRSPLGAAVVTLLGVWVVFAGVWIWRAGVRQLHPGPEGYRLLRTREDPARLRGQRWFLTGRVLSWILPPLLLGEALWFLASAEITTIFSYRLFTIWALFHVLFTVVVLALTVDVLHQDSERVPLRVLVLGGGVLLYAFLSDTKVVEPGEAGPLPATSGAAPSDLALRRTSREADRSAWLRQLLARVQSIPEGEGPVVFLAASGGGSRAAIFSALALEMLGRTPVDGGRILSARGPGSAAPGLPEARAQEAGGTSGPRTWADHVALISSVSGGSLASAWFVTGYADRAWEQGIREFRNTTSGELLYRAALAGRERVLRLRDDERSHRPPGSASGLPEVKKADQRDARDLARLAASGQLVGWMEEEYREAGRLLEQLEGAIAQAREQEAPRALVGDLDDHAGRLEALRDALQAAAWLHLQHDEGTAEGSFVGAWDHRYSWVLQSRFFDLMCLDFMAPILRGVMVPGRLSRGESLRIFWEEQFGWEGLSNVTWSQGKDTGPSLVLNATDVQDGSRLMIGLPPQPTHALPPGGGTPDRGGPIPMGLSRAVRLSSNFPWGFRVNELRLGAEASKARDQLLEPGLQEREPWARRVLDGGIVDNTGLDTIHDLTAWISALAQEQPEAGPGSSHGLARSLLAALRARGLVILEVDSGAKGSSKVPRPLPSLREPMQALSNAGFVNSGRVHDQFLGDIVEAVDPEVEVGDKSPLRGRGLALHVVLQCNHTTSAEEDEEVMTAWTLSPKDKAEVLARFLIELGRWDRIRGPVRDALELVRLERLEQTLARSPLAQLEAEEVSDEAVQDMNQFVEQIGQVEQTRLPDPVLRKDLEDLHVLSQGLAEALNEGGEAERRSVSPETRRRIQDLKAKQEEVQRALTDQKALPPRESFSAIDRSRKALERVSRPPRKGEDPPLPRP